MESAQSSVKLADVLRCVLAAVERAPTAIRDPAFIGSDPLSAAFRQLLLDEEPEVQHDGTPAALELPEALEAALNVAAGRGLAALLASVLACTNRACRAAVGAALGSAAARATRVAHAQAMHDMARALRESKDELSSIPDEVANGLAAWCLIADASSALGEYYADEASPSRKWNAFAREVAHAAEMPPRILLARRCCTLQMVAQAGAALRGGVMVETTPEFDEMSELADESRGPWRDRLVELAQRAPK